MDILKRRLGAAQYEDALFEEDLRNQRINKQRERGGWLAFQLARQRAELEGSSPPVYFGMPYVPPSANVPDSARNEAAKRRDLVRRIVKEAFEDPIESGKFHLTPAQAILTQESDAPEMSDEDLRALDDVFRKVKEYQEKTEDIFTGRPRHSPRKMRKKPLKD